MSWPMVSIASVAKVITGKTPPKADPNCFGGNIPFITPSELTDSDYLLKAETTLTEKGLATTKLIPKNSILVCCIGSLGKMAMADLPVATNQQINSVIFDEDKIYYRFGFYALKLLKNELKNIAPSTTVAIVNKSRFSELKIPHPPLEEQRRIAAILDKATGICQKREKAIKLADDFLRATFLEMFSQLEHGANKVKLGDIVALDAPMVDPKEEEYIDLIHIGPDRIEKNTGLLLPALTARDENLISKKFLFDENYVLYSKIRPYLKKCGIPDFSGLCSADMYPVKPIKNKTNREFLWQLLLSDFFTKYTETLPDRASIPKLNRKELLNFELSLPPISLQENYKHIVQKTNHTKLAMRTQNSNNLLNRLENKFFPKDK